MNTPTPPPRLFALIAQESGIAAVLRRGPSKQVACLRWDLSTDQVEEGQWLKARVFARRCDVSPCGKYLIYFALDGRWSSRAKGAYTAISKVPYFSALKLAPVGHTWGGGGVWSSEHYDGVGESRAAIPLPVEAKQGFGFADRSVYFPRLLRDGWRMTKLSRYSGLHVGHGVFVRDLEAGVRLVKVGKENSKAEMESHTVISIDGTVLEEHPDWEWADVYRGRLLYAKHGKLWAQKIHQHSRGDALVIYDLNQMRFRTLAPPYSALNRVG